MKARLATLGADAFPMEPAAFNSYIRAEVESAALIARTANLKAQ